MPVPVWFTDMKARSDKRNTVSKVAMLMEKVLASGALRPGDLSAIKIHFGEVGNDSYVSPVFARKVADAAKALGAKPFFTDTATLYSGQRSNAVDHLGTAALHGFVPEVAGAPVLIADGLRSNDWREVEIGRKWFQKAKIAGSIVDADSLIVISHFKGHEMSGFGGAIKNLAMGCAPAAGKREQHSCRFFVRQDRCVACGKCAEVCPVGAATQEGSAKAVIDRARCIGCGECSLFCPPKSIAMDWSVEIVEFTEKLAEYAFAAVKGKEGRVVYLTFVTDVVPECDCAPWSDIPLVSDIGILASTDPVAIDRAAFELVKAAEVPSNSPVSGKAGPGVDKFAAFHHETRGEVQLVYGEAIGLGSNDYELIRL
ncbi:MAG: DUF362 domain-containing protein [Spirochaetes bacterium]|nr:DUF362 domain-containing protein [Spirochaetota bacterium]